MKVQFKPINKPNQSFKSLFEISNNPNKKLKYDLYKYNNIEIFKYNFVLKGSEIIFIIIPTYEDSTFSKKIIGSFIFDISKKYNLSEVNIHCTNKILLEFIVIGFRQKDFIFNRYKTKSNFSSFKTAFKLSNKNDAYLSSLQFLKELVSEPSNVIYPESFAKRVSQNLNKSQINFNILNKSKIKKIGLNCLLAVSQGSAKEPRVMEFSNKKFKKNVDILFVGKGVCFDSGGISIKPSAGMEDMKWDMGGAAVTVSIMRYLSKIKSNFSYAGIVGLVENMPSSTAYKPGDIIKSYKGINVEVLNTDAEGRLVLADIITYGCEKYKPKIVIDFATLTGAIMVALGQHYAGLFCNDNNLASELYNSGIKTNEKVWRMPLHNDFDKELNSPFVDLKNIGAGRYGGSVTAAQFLQRFIPSKTKWAHLDIAGTTWKNSGDTMNSMGATGFGLTLIADFIDTYFKN